ncbi:MAG: hypothetical protein GXY83_12985 [Rhodopirellula sp.]|nr:hypothetical protein [Rhodopirellula sp.]
MPVAFSAVVSWMRSSLLGLVLAAPLVAMAETPLPSVVRVEEDWELVVGAPDHYTDAPQVTCAISPLGTIESIHATFDLNHQSQPEFTAGGLQLQLWEGEVAIDYRGYPNPAVLRQDDETVCWTQRMELSGGQLQFEIVNGNSVTWGQFGGQGYLKSVTPTNLENFNGYRPSVSVDNSGVGYAGNRVRSLTLKAVRVYTDTGDVFTDSAIKTVYPKN